MAIIRITFKNRLNKDGEPFELPADKIDTNGARIDSYEYIEKEIRDGDDFAREIWEYEIPDKDADRFTEGVKKTPSVLEYKRM